MHLLPSLASNLAHFELLSDSVRHGRPAFVWKKRFKKKKEVKRHSVGTYRQALEEFLVYGRSGLCSGGDLGELACVRFNQFGELLPEAE